jgi:hypothetical protein
MMTAHTRQLLATAGRRVAAVVTLAVSTMAGAGFLIAAGWTELATYHGSVMASLLIGSTLLVPLAGVCLVLALCSRVREPKHPAALFTLDRAVLAFVAGAKVGSGLARSTRVNSSSH